MKYFYIENRYKNRAALTGHVIKAKDKKEGLKGSQTNNINLKSNNYEK